MTEDEFKKLPFECVCTMAFEDEHTITYANKRYDIGYCQHTEKNGEEFGESFIHYRYKDKVFTDYQKFLKAIRHLPIFKIIQRV